MPADLLVADVVPVVNYCPFGCPMEALGANGYCKHLAGFTNDGNTYEPIEDQIGRHGEKTGHKLVNGQHRQPVQKTDQKINPTFQQRGNDGIIRTAKSWVSARVYRELVETEAELEEATRP